jgi:hypothetical protein
MEAKGGKESFLGASAASRAVVAAGLGSGPAANKNETARMILFIKFKNLCAE